MTHDHDPETTSDGEAPTSRIPDWLTALLLTEAAVVLIAFVIPVTPSKTGSEWSPAHFFSADPSYLAEVLAAFVTLNLLVLVIGLLAWVSMRRERRD